MPTSRPRIDDVARLAGVSKTAVSFAFNQPDELNEATRDRILAIARDLGYRPSPIARRLAARRTDQIGLVIPQPTHEIFANPFLPELLRGMGDVCDEEGLGVLIVPPRRGSIARSVERALVDGLVLLGLGPDHPEVNEVRRAGLPLLALDADGWADADVITSDDHGGSRAAGDHLRTLGHRTVGVVVIAAHPDSAVDEQAGISGRRLAGLREGLGLAPDADESPDGETRLRICSSTVSVEGGRAAFDLLAEDGLPTAIVTMSDVTAIGIMSAARDAGVSVPEELSVVGYDDVPAAGWTNPSLTTVHQPIREKGRRAAARLIELIRGSGPPAPALERLATRLVVRGSTAPALAAIPGSVAARRGGGVTLR